MKVHFVVRDYGPAHGMYRYNASPINLDNRITAHGSTADEALSKAVAEIKKYAETFKWQFAEREVEL